MSINLVDNLLVNTALPTDSRYGPYASDAIAIDAIPAGQRYLGLTVGIITSGVVTDYWWFDGLYDTDLKPKTLGNTIDEGNGITITSSGGIDTIEIDTDVVQIVNNISTDVIPDGSSDDKYPSVKAIKDYVDGIVVAAFNDRGNYAPNIGSPGPYPATGGSGSGFAIMAGDFWTISSDGFLGTTSVATGDVVRALIDTPGQIDTNWAILNTGFGFVAENTANKVSSGTSVTANSTNAQLYPSLKALTEYVTGVIPQTPGLTDVLSTAPSGNPPGNVAKDIGIIIRTTGSTGYALTVENKYSTNKEKVVVATGGVSVYSNTVDNAYTQLANGNINIVDGSGTRTFSFPSTGGTLALAGNNVTVANNSALSISLTNQLNTVYNTTKTGNTTATVGGIPSGTSFSQLNTLTLVQLLDRMFDPTQLPTYTIPTLTTTGTGDFTGSITREIGTYISGTITVTGIKNDAGPFSAITFYKSVNGTATIQPTTLQDVTPAPGDIASLFGFPDPNNPNSGKKVTFTEPSSTYQVPAPPISGGSSTVNYYGIGSYGAGSAKQDQSGAPDTRTPLVRNNNAPQAASPTITIPPTPPDFQSNSITVTGYYPIFYGTYNVGSTQPSSATIKTLIQTKSYSSSTSYIVDDLAVNGNIIYKCITPTTGTFNPAHWTQVGTRVKVIASGGNDISATFGNTGSDVRWWFVAQDAAFTQKVYWTQVGNPLSTNVAISGNYAVSTESITSPDILTGITPLWSNINYKIYISNLKPSSDSAAQVYKYTVSQI